MNGSLYVSLSVMMFLEFAIWGAWMPVLATRLLGPLKMSGKQTGWIYATLPLGCIVAPLVAGHMADRWLHTEWILAGAHLLGAGLLVLAARLEKFRPLLAVMLLYSFCYAATLPLVNSLMFAQLSKHPELNIDSGKIFIWAPIAWALTGYFLAAWRWLFKTEGQGRDCLMLSAVLSLIMGATCFYLPPTLPAGTGGMPIVKAMAMLADSNFSNFLLISLVISGLMQFYFLGTGRFLQDLGVSGKNISAAMALAQVVQAAATWFLLGWCITKLGFRATLLLGAAAWLVMYAVYVLGKPRGLIIAAQAFHGLAYVLFVIAGQIYANNVAPENIRSSIQALVFAATTGIGLFLGTQAAGIVMDRLSREGKFQWGPIWLVPGTMTLAGLIALAVFFHG